MRAPPCVLTIAGSDSGAGAGIQADSRTIHALGGYALSAITAVTAQNTRGISAWRATPPALIAAQVESVLADFPVGAIKAGLLPGAAAVRAVAKALQSYRHVPLVIDPVMGSTSGTRFLSPHGVRILTQTLLPRATLITPNWPEVEALTGLRIRTFVDVALAARRLLKTGCQAVLVKGGHGPGPICRDCLVTRDALTRWFESPQVKTRNTHGTGCVLSAAITLRLARGESVELASAYARKFLIRCLRAGRQLHWDAGAGPAFLGDEIDR